MVMQRVYCEVRTGLNELQGLAHPSTGTSFPLAVPFHQRSTPSFILTLLLSEGQAGEAWEPSNKQGFLTFFVPQNPLRVW